LDMKNENLIVTVDEQVILPCLNPGFSVHSFIHHLLPLNSHPITCPPTHVIFV